MCVHFSQCFFILAIMVLIIFGYFSLVELRNVWIITKCSILDVAVVLDPPLPILRIQAAGMMFGFFPYSVEFTGLLFDFNVFTKHFTHPQLQMVMKGKNKATRIITWQDIKQRFKNISTVKFQKTTIPKIRQVTGN